MVLLTVDTCFWKSQSSMIDCLVFLRSEMNFNMRNDVVSLVCQYMNY